jgi:imidazolonepropionase-like amidohydrolase
MIRALTFSAAFLLAGIGSAQEKKTPPSPPTAVGGLNDATPPLPPQGNYAIKAGKIFTAAGPNIDAGVILVKAGKIEAVGPAAAVKIPDGYKVIDASDKFVMPGLIECHCHVGGTGDLNEMVYQTNPELRVLDQVVPHNDLLKRAIAGGVTTVCYIPGSGTNMGGFGVIMKAGPGKKTEDVVVRFPGVLKIAQAGNPERQAGEVGSGRIGMNYVIREQLREGMGYVKDWDDFEAGKRKTKPALNLRLENFKPLFHREIPVLVHTQGYHVVMSTLRILHDEMNLKVIIGHGTFDSFKLTKEITERKIPSMIGPRGFWLDPDTGHIRGVVYEQFKRGQEFIGVNTDSPVVPQEELFFQASMAVRYGLPEDVALRGLTIKAAEALMIDKRVGSIEPGKDADIIVLTGPVIDPRNYVTMALIDGRIVYDVKVDRRRF